MMTFTEPAKNFLLSMWLQCRLTPEEVQTAIARGKITQEEANIILATPRDCP